MDGDAASLVLAPNGRPDFADVVLSFSQVTRISASRPVPVFGYNGNGRIGFADPVWLFNQFSGPGAPPPIPSSPGPRSTPVPVPSRATPSASIVGLNASQSQYI